MLNPENTRKVIAALRSGDHQQGIGNLENVNGAQCCLGVACRVAMANGVEVSVEDIGAMLEFDGWGDVMPPAVAAWLTPGTTEQDLDLIVPDHVRAALEAEEVDRTESAIALNDEWGATFAQIADCLEATLNHQQRVAA